MRVIWTAAFVWIFGFLHEVFRYMCGRARIRLVIKHSSPAPVPVQEIGLSLKEELKIRRKIPICESFGQDIPVIVGFLRCRILLPEKEYKDNDLEMILEHELLHYKHKDLVLKKLCAWIVRIQWFNPMTKLLFAEIDTWGDAMCDLEICHGERRRRGIREYFTVVMENSRRKKASDRPMEMGLSGAEKMYRRIERMRKYKKEKDFKRWTAFLLTLCFVMASSITSMAAGKGVEAAYNTAYKATAVQKEDSLSEGEEENLEEYTWILGEDRIVTQFEENPYTRGVEAYNWTIPGGEVYETGMFWGTKGDTVVITVNPYPQGAATSAGLHQPNGVMRGVSSTGVYAHTFTLTQTGFHRVYVDNKESKTIDVALSVSR